MKIRALADLPDLSLTHATARDAVDFAIQRLQYIMADPRLWRRRNRTPSGPTEVFLWLRRDLPYRIHSTTLPDTQILTNREQKPVGSNVPGHGGHWLRYQDYPNLHVRLTPEQIGRVVLRRVGGDALFDDGCPPWGKEHDALGYLERLRRLLGYIEATEEAESV